MQVPGTARPLKIALIAHIDAGDRRTLSGTPYQIGLLLSRHLGEVTRIDNLIPANMTLWYMAANWFSSKMYLLFLECLKSLFWRLLNQRYDWRISLNASRYCALQIDKKLSEDRFDLIWVEKSSIAMPFVTTDVPIIYESDATFHALLDYYPWFTGQSKSAIRNGETLERMSLRKAAAIVHTADWAKQSAMNDYGIAPDMVTVLPSPPNCDHVPPRDIVLREKQTDECNLLFVGVDWERKGGDIAVATTDELSKRGIPAKLHICGCQPPRRYNGHPRINVIGFLDKNNRTDLAHWEELFLGAHFFILPTRAECMGISFSEAAGFGLPIIATDTGGVPTVVKNNRNGLLFSLDESPEFIAAQMAGLWNDPVRYRAMRVESRRFFDEEISEEAWIATVKAITRRLVPSARL